jgi:Na+-transporting NADH:ubiquinone oxidoreductase subunit B
MLPVLGVTLLVTLVWDMVFAVLRSNAPNWHNLTTALILTVLIPVDVPLWQVGLAASFGVVIGEQVFGGRGFGFLSPSVVALVFLVFSFPGTVLIGANHWIALATVPGACLLFATGLISWRVLVALAAGVGIASLTAGGIPDLFPTVSALAFGAVFLIADPMASASTNAGRWLYGLLVGGLSVLFSIAPSGELTSSALVFAALLGSLFAPLLDHLVVLSFARRRRARHVS